jgi:hypothetical protein
MATTSLVGRTPACSRVRQEEAGRAPAHEDEVIEHGAEQPDDSLEKRTVRVNHALGAVRLYLQAAPEQPRIVIHC